MPINFGIIHAINSAIGLNERKSGFVRIQIVEDIDKGFCCSEVDFYMKNINIHDALFNVLNERDMAAGVS